MTFLHFVIMICIGVILHIVCEHVLHMSDVMRYITVGAIIIILVFCTLPKGA